MENETRRQQPEDYRGRSRRLMRRYKYFEQIFSGCNGMGNSAASSLLRTLGFLFSLLAVAAVISALFVFFTDDSRFEERFTDCKLLVYEGDLAGARSELLKLHAENKSHIGLIQALGEIAERQRDFPEAITWLRRLPESAAEGAAATARFRASQMAMQLGRARMTEVLAKEAIRLAPTLPGPRRLLLRQYFVLLEQRKLYEQSALMDKQNMLSPIDLAMRVVAHRASWDDDEHIVWLEQCLREEPANTIVRAALIHNHGHDGRNAEARKLITGAPPDAPEFWRIQLARAEREVEQGDFHRALATLNDFPIAADGESRTWLVRARVWQELGYNAAALVAWKNAATLDPYDPTASYAASRILAADVNAKQANALFERSQQQKELMRFMSRLMEASNPAVQAVEPVAVTMRRAREAFAKLGFGREAKILSQGQSIATPESSPKEPLLTAAADFIPLKSIQTRPPANAIAEHRLPDANAATHSAANGGVGALRFVDIAQEIGLSFQYDTGRSPYRWLMETLGGGVAVLDYDRDGWDDLYFTQGGPLPVRQSAAAQDRLFKNVGGEAAQDVTAAARLSDSAYGQGCAVGDYDNDGFADLLVCNYGACLLFKNQGDGTFKNVSRAAGVSSSKWSTSAAFSDIDRDGDLDLYVVHYLDADYESLTPCKLRGAYTSCRPFGFAAVQDTLWENDGQGHFVDKTKEYGLTAVDGKGLGVAFVNFDSGDFDGYGRDSIFVGNDTTANFLFQRVDGSTVRFQNNAGAAGAAVNGRGLSEACMGVATGDINGDGLLDLFVTNFQGETNTLYENLGGGLFADATEKSGLADASRNRLGFGCQFLDIDCNGRLDLFVANGLLHEIPQRAQLFYNLKHGRFGEVSQTAGDDFRQPRLGRSVALVDWNRDRQTDVAVTYQTGNVSLLENRSAAGNRIVLRLTGVAANRDAIGALVRARIGDQTHHFQVTRCGGYFAANDPKILVGCGAAEKIDHLEVCWPSGRVAAWQDVGVGETYLLIEGDERLFLQND